MFDSIIEAISDFFIVLAWDPNIPTSDKKYLLRIEMPTPGLPEIPTPWVVTNKEYRSFFFAKFAVRRFLWSTPKENWARFPISITNNKTGEVLRVT